MNFANITNATKNVRDAGYNFSLTITSDVERRFHIATKFCRDKKHARKICAEYNAQPWNF